MLSRQPNCLLYIMVIMKSLDKQSTSTGPHPASIPELVGRIFACMEYFDLSRVQQVCKRWYECIRDVKSLQPTLYKAADEKIDEKYSMSFDTDPGILSTTLGLDQVVLVILRQF